MKNKARREILTDVSKTIAKRGVELLLIGVCFLFVTICVSYGIYLAGEALDWGFSISAP